MSGFYDIYALCPARAVATAEKFLAEFAPEREQSATEYPVPYMSDEQGAVLTTPTAVISYCIEHPTEPYGLYWRSLGHRDPEHVMMFFTSDGALIVGVSIVSEPKRWLGQLLAATSGLAGYIAFEQAPPLTTAEFLTMASRHAEQSLAAESR